MSYQQQIKELAKELYSAMLKELKDNPNASFSEILDKYMQEYNEDVLGIIREELSTIINASLSAGIVLPTVTAIAPDMSKRLYKNAKDTSKVVKKVLDEHIKTKSTINEIRKALYDGYGYEEVLEINKTLPKYLRKPLTEAQLKRLKTPSLRASYFKVMDAKSEREFEKALKVALEERARYYALRIAVTEEQKAFTLANVMGMMADKEEYVRFTLSPSHKSACVCDYYANLNMGYGRGVYRLKSAPLPVYSTHPFCRCTLQPISKVSYKFISNPSQKTLDKFNKIDRNKIEYGLVNGWKLKIVEDLVK